MHGFFVLICALCVFVLFAAAADAASVPGAPRAVSAVRGDSEATVSFKAPLSDGGSPITSYTATSHPGKLQATVTTLSSITVQGLKNGTAYYFTVTATNAIGTGPASSPSNVVIPATIPGTPTSVTATGGNALAIVRFKPPASNGGSRILYYLVTSNPGNVTVKGAASPIIVRGLTNGTAYTFTVTAVNAIGPCLQPAQSNEVTPATIPGAPGNVTATGGNAQASVSFTAPASDGGSGITGYIVTATPGGKTASGTASPITVTGLTNGVVYRFTVRAVNGIGKGPPSTLSNSVRPATTPGAPRAVTATAGNAMATVRFTAPATNGGSPITGYLVTPNSGEQTGSGKASPITVQGLTNGTPYSFTVSAINAAGTGAASSPSNIVTPNGGGGANIPTLVQHVDVNLAETNTQTPRPNGLVYISSRTVPLPNPTGAGNCLIVSVNSSASAVPTVTDDAGNTYTQVAYLNDTTNGQSITVFAVLNAVAGARNLKVHWGGSGAQYTAIKVSEFYNVTALDAHSTSITNEATITGGSVTPSVSGDLLYMVGFQDSTAYSANAFYSLQTQSGITWNFVPCSTQSLDGSFAIYGQYNSTLAIAPQAGTSSTQNYITATLALRTGAHGTAPRSGIRVVGAQHVYPGPYGNPSSFTTQFITTGNLQVALGSLGTPTVAGISSSGANTASWVSRAFGTYSSGGAGGAQVLDSENTNSGNQVLTVTLGGTAESSAFIFLDVSGAAASPYGANADLNDASSNNTSTVTGIKITPSTSNGLIVNVQGDFAQTIGTMNSPSYCYSFTSVETQTAGEATTLLDYSESDDNDGFGFCYNPNTSPVTFVYNVDEIDGSYSTGIGPFSSAAVAYNAAGSTATASASEAAPAPKAESPATGNTVTANPEEQTASGTTGTAATVTGLTGGGASTSTATPTNDAIGTAPASSSSSSATSTAPGATAFPLKISADQRHLVDQNDVSFLIVGDAAWSLIAQLDKADVDAYLADRQSRGFNTIIVNLIEHHYAANAPADFYGDLPFTSQLNDGVHWDMTTPNPAYFEHADWVINQAAEYGMLVILAPDYMGYDCGEEGWCSDMIANGATRMETYGAYVGNRYKNFPNVLWINAIDMNTANYKGATAALQAMVTGLTANDPNHLNTFDCTGGGGANPLSPATTGYDCYDWRWLDVNLAYYNTGCTSYSSIVKHGYSQVAMPLYYNEGQYEGEGAQQQCLDIQAYNSVLGGAFGSVFGNNPIWCFNGGCAPPAKQVSGTWQDALGLQGSINQANFGAFFKSIPWDKLVPDYSHSVLTSGYGTLTDSSYVGCARTSDGRYIVAYLPTRTTVTIDMSQISSSSLTASWFNPSTAAYTSIGTFSNTGTQDFTPPESGDWVLLLTGE